MHKLGAVLSFTLLAVAVVIGVLFIAGQVGSRYTRADYMADLKPIIDDWDDTMDVANNSARISLPPQVTRMQEIRNRAEELDIPAVALSAHQELLDYMDYTIRGFIAFMAQDEDSEVQGFFERASKRLDAWTVKAGKLDE